MSLVVKGISSEYEVIADLIKQGYTPSIPALPTSPYDIIAEKAGAMYKIQVKSSVFEGNKISVHTRKSNGNKDERRYTTQEIDIIAIHDREGKRTAYIPNEGLTKLTIYSELPKSRNGYRKDDVIRVFDEYREIGQASA